MWWLLAVMFATTVAVSAVVGTLAKARLIEQLAQDHPDTFERLGRPHVWLNRSFSQGIALQRFVFSSQPPLSDQAESSRINLRRVTAAVIGALLANVVAFAWVLLSFLQP